jgi:integrase
MLTPTLHIHKGGDFCMVGGIYSDQRCPICNGPFQDNHKDGLICPVHPNQRATRFKVKFGRKICRRFASDYKSAQRFLNGLRFKNDEGTFDVRDYQKDNPLGFETLVSKWLAQKKKDLKKKSWNNLNNYMNKSILVWGNRNIKTINDGDIDDFLYGAEVSAKTRNNMKSCLHDFWKWIVRREKRQGKKMVEMPEFPDCPFKLGWRNIIDIETQQKVIAEIYRLTYHINPKIWLGVRWLSRYTMVRPGELLSVNEGQINTKIPAIIIPDPKGGEPVLVFLHDDDVKEIEKLPRGLPGLPFFRHVGGIQSVRAGQKFGERYLYKWWKRACAKIGVEDVDLYGGTRHSTLTALGEFLSPEEVKRGSLHKTNKALERYLQGKARYAKKVSAEVLKMQKDKGSQVIKFKKKK